LKIVEDGGRSLKIVEGVKRRFWCRKIPADSAVLIMSAHLPLTTLSFQFHYHAALSVFIRKTGSMAVGKTGDKDGLCKNCLFPTGRTISADLSNATRRNFYRLKFGGMKRKEECWRQGTLHDNCIQ